MNKDQDEIIDLGNQDQLHQVFLNHRARLVAEGPYLILKVGNMSYYFNNADFAGKNFVYNGWEILVPDFKLPKEEF
jgi:hypothetical protein